MGFFKRIFQKQEKPIKSYADFWKWFQRHEQQFFQVLKNGGDIHKVFFAAIAPKLEALKDGFWYSAGMFSPEKAELIITADGDVKNFVFVEELVAAAPDLNNWKFTALKQGTASFDFGIRIGGFEFNSDNMHFYAIEQKDMPDEIDIRISHPALDDENRTTITNGVYLALDNYLGELYLATVIDRLEVIAPSEAEQTLVPIEKLKDFLRWREKEFVEKYEEVRYNTKDDTFSGLEATLRDGLPLFAVINRDLLSWDRKASHPWILVVEVPYDSSENHGLPEENMIPILDQLEDDIITQLREQNGYLNIGRQTADSLRKIYFACVEFRKPSKVLHQIQKKYKEQLDIDFDIYKDKYWQSFQRFQVF